MTSSREKLAKVFGTVAAELDQRYPDYARDATQALARIIKTQSDTASDAMRSREVDRIIESLAEKLQASTSSD